MRSALLALSLLALSAPHAFPGSLIDVAVEVGGRPVPLYDAVDGSGRLYFEARQGSPYALRLTNRSHERLGAVIVVDGLNVISGERETIGRGSPGRMYILAPWGQVEVRGWRTSLEQVRQFTFVDEKSSYAARADKANARMGWIEVAAYRDRNPPRVGALRREAPAAEAQSAPSADASGASNESKSARGAAAPSHPGTGWGGAAYDPAIEVRFDAEATAAERTVLRYEYAPALRALGVLPSPQCGDRLRQRERGEGFAAAPLR